MLIDGKKIAEDIYNKLKMEIKKLEKKPSLGIILVGDNSSSIRYIKQKEKWANFIGIKFKLKKLKKDISKKDLLKEINNFNKNNNIDGFMLQLPLPKHINEKEILKYINEKKDVDGFNPINQGKVLVGDNSGFIPCTPAGIIEIIKSEKIDLEGKVVCVIGKSNIVGKPIISLLINKGATVIACNSKTKNLKDFTRQADIIVSATGQVELIKSNMLKQNSTVIDVGFTVVSGKIYGDAKTDIIDKLGHKITPVPGGVGPLTVAMLMKNVLKAYKHKNK